ncbi:MAG: SLBB domain-containing protein [Armatimonadota bacterium]
MDAYATHANGVLALRTKTSRLPGLVAISLLLLATLAAFGDVTTPVSAALPEAAKTEVTARLKSFGYDFFAGAPTDFSVAPDASVPADYRLDTNDVVRVRYWTPTIAEISRELTVNQAGAVAVPDIGDVKAAHLTMEEFTKNLGQRLREQLKNPSFAADLITPRTISIFVTGAAKRPGRYTVRADANLFNVVYAAGGATEEGSLRAIALKRQNIIVATLDAYQFLLGGVLGKQVLLEDQDIVFVPTAGARVEIGGKVTRPAMYEISEGTRLADALAMAGGMKAAAYPRLLRLQRVENGQRVERTLNAQALVRDTKHADNLLLQDGDVLTVEDVAAQVRERVTIRGNVEHPGSYATTRTPTAKALLSEAKVQTGALWERADLLRTLDDGTPVVIPLPVKSLLDGKATDIPLVDQDEIIVYRTDEKLIIPLVAVDGAIKHPASYRVTDGMHVSDLLFAAGGLRRDAAPAVAHLYRRNGPNQYKIIRLSPTSALQGNATDNPVLQDEDRLVIYTQQDVEYRAEKLAVVGEVQRPGEYTLYQGLTLYDLLLQAGGPTDMAAGTIEVTFPAAPDSAIKRTEVKIWKLAEVMGGAHANEPLVAGMLVSLPRQGDKLTHPRQVMLRGQFRRPGVYALLSEDEDLASVVERAGGYTDDSDPFGMSLTREKDKMLSNATAQQVKTIMDALDQMLPPLDKAAGTARNTTDIMDVTTPAISPLEPAGSRTEKVLLVSPRRLTGMPTSNRISFNLEDRKSYLSRLGKVRLADGDIIEVPRKSQVVQVLGAVQSPGPVFYQADSLAKDFINRAGGCAADADMKRAVVVKVSGAVQVLTDKTTIDSGDVIIVPSKYQVIQPPTQRRTQDTLLNLLGTGLIIRGLL